MNSIEQKVTMRPAFQSKNQIIHGVLLDAIIQGEFPPSTRLIIDEMAAKFEVSPIPIREALRQLEADGFVSFEPHVGFTVTPIQTHSAPHTAMAACVGRLASAMLPRAVAGFASGIGSGLGSTGAGSICCWAAWA